MIFKRNEGQVMQNLRRKQRQENYKIFWGWFGVILFWLIVIWFINATANEMNSNPTSSNDPGGYYQHPGEY